MYFTRQIVEIHQREFFLYRILSGYIFYKIGNVELKIKSPTLDVLYKASEIAFNAYETALKNEIMTDIDIYNMMIENGMWTAEKENQLNNILPKHIEHWKTEMYKSFFRSKDREKLRKFLNTAKKELTKLYNERHAFDHSTCNGIANYAKIQYIIEKSTFTKNDKLYSWKNSSPYLAMVFFQENLISEDNLRLISHTHPWDGIWSAAKKSGQVFSKPATELSNDQQRLIVWSSMYDSIRDTQDCPPDELINDDDCLDGWLIIKKQERDAQNNQIAAAKLMKNDKIANANEVYLVAQSVDDAKKIDMLNSSSAKEIKKQRFEHISKRGEIKEGALPDVKRQLQIDMNRALMQNARR